MSRLVEELKSEHVALKKALKQASDFRIPAIERVAMLDQIKTVLLAHLDKENRELYPTLKVAAERDPSLRRTMKTFAEDMEAITKQVMEFFDTYQDAGRVTEQLQTNVHSLIQFGGHLERLVSLLGFRIGREERILYPEYDRIAFEMNMISPF